MTDISDILEKAKAEGRNYLLEPEAKEIIARYGIPVTKIKVGKDLDEVLKYAGEIGYPVVLKIVSPDVIHKSDIGGVKINLRNKAEVERAYKEIIAATKRFKPDARIVGVLVQEFVPQGTEIIIGVSKDPQFGPTIMFGLGGIFVEILEDVSFRIIPITRRDAKEMISEIKGYKVLMGARGRETCDIEAIINALLSVSKLAWEHQEIKELDLNPIEVYSKGLKVVDARIVLEG
ncbi:MAG: acetyl-CoA synthetase [Thermoproteota archaeon]|nr:MAG: acetyl-CoA synthetase [Candidatus Korarchaeota archaeon]